MLHLLAAPTTVLPIAGLLWYNSKQPSQHEASPSFLLRTWIISGLLGPLLCAPVQLAILWPVGKVLFGSRFDEYLTEMGRSEAEVKGLDETTVALRREIAYSVPHWISCVALAAAGPLVEEAFKYAVLRTVDKYYPDQVARSRKRYVLIGMAVGLGFAFVENVGFIAATKFTLPREAVQHVLERAIFGSCGHLFTAALTACKYAASARRDTAMPAKGTFVSMGEIIKESVLYHGLGNFSLFAITSLYGNVSFIHPPDALGYTSMAACLLAVNFTAALRFKHEWNKLDKMEAMERKSS